VTSLKFFLATCASACSKSDQDAANQELDKAKDTAEQKGGTIHMGPHQVPTGDYIVIGSDPQGAEFALVGGECLRFRDLVDGRAASHADLAREISKYAALLAEARRFQ